MVECHVNLKKNDFVMGHLLYYLLGKHFCLVAPYSCCEAWNLSCECCQDDHWWKRDKQSSGLYLWVFSFPLSHLQRNPFNICMLIIYQVFPHQNRIIKSDEGFQEKKKVLAQLCQYIYKMCLFSKVPCLSSQYLSKFCGVKGFPID